LSSNTYCKLEYQPDTEKREKLKEIDSLIRGCYNCPLRDDTGEFGPTLPQGFCDVEIMIVGRNPGLTELENGIPFIGDSGAMINDMLKKVGLTRRDCWITNVNKCYSNKNRKPTDNEISICSKYLKMEVETIKPKLILVFGNEAMSQLTPYYSGVTKHCGDIIDNPKCKMGNLYNTKVLIFPHPSYVMRNKEKGKVLFDKATGKLSSLLEVFKC